MPQDPRPQDVASLQEQITERTLRLVDRQIGQGEAPSTEEWQELRALSPTSDGVALVAELESVVRRFDEQLQARYGSAEGAVDVVRLRQGLAHLVRAIVQRKLETAAPVRPPAPGSGEVE